MKNIGPVSLCVILDTCSKAIMKVVVSYLRKESKKGKSGLKVVISFH